MWAIVGVLALAGFAIGGHFLQQEERGKELRRQAQQAEQCRKYGRGEVMGESPTVHRAMVKIAEGKCNPDGTVKSATN